MKRYLLYQLAAALAMANLAWVGYHMLYFARGISPLLLQEPNTWVARGELAFVSFCFLAAVVAFIMLIVYTRKGKCALCDRPLVKKGGN